MKPELIFVQDVKIRSSLDRVVLKLAIPSGIDINLFIKEHLEDFLVYMDYGFLCQDDYKFYSHNLNVKNLCYLSWGFNDKDDDGFDINHIRLDFNPNKTNVHALAFIFNRLPKEIKSTIRYSRLDFCIDYQNIVLHPELFYHSRKRKGRLYFNGDVFETAYLGSQKSDVQFRVYNKIAELLYRNKKKFIEDFTIEELEKIKLDYDLTVNAPLWRVECQLRKNAIVKVLGEGFKPFDGLECFANYPDVDCEVKFKHFVCAVKCQGLQVTLKQIKDRHTRKTYLNFLRQYAKPMKHPSLIFDEDFRNIFNKFDKEFRTMIQEIGFRLY